MNGGFFTCPRSSAASPDWTRIGRQSWMAGEEGRLMMGWQSSLVPQPLLLMRLVVEGKGLIKWLGMLQRDVSLKYIRGSSILRHTGKGGKLNTSQAEPFAASSWAVGQFLSISCEAIILMTRYKPPNLTTLSPTLSMTRERTCAAVFVAVNK